MVRVRTGPTRRRRHKKFLKKAKGARGARSKLYRTARESVARSLVYAYKGRKARKSDFRRLWITRIRAACIPCGISYSRFINGLKKAEVTIDRKILADLAVNDKAAFKELAKLAKESIG